MKKNNYHIIKTWLLLFCFAAGQYMVYAHTHSDSIAAYKPIYQHTKPQPKQILSENCRLCDAMHHSAMATSSQAYFAPVVIAGYFYKMVHYDLISVKLIKSAGRAPPTA